MMVPSGMNPQALASMVGGSLQGGMQMVPMGNGMQAVMMPVSMDKAQGGMPGMVGMAPMPGMPGMGMAGMGGMGGMMPFVMGSGGMPQGFVMPTMMSQQGNQSTADKAKQQQQEQDKQKQSEKKEEKK